MKCLAFEIIFCEIKALKQAAANERLGLIANYKAFNTETKQLFVMNGLTWDNRR